MSKFKPNYLLDEQMLFSDAKTALAHQIREELRESNRLLRKLVEQKEETSTENVADTQEPSPDTNADNVGIEAPDQTETPDEVPAKLTKSKPKK